MKRYSPRLFTVVTMILAIAFAGAGQAAPAIAPAGQHAIAMTADGTKNCAACDTAGEFVAACASQCLAGFAAIVGNPLPQLDPRLAVGAERRAVAIAGLADAPVLGPPRRRVS